MMATCALYTLGPSPAFAGMEQVLLDSGQFQISIDGAGSSVVSDLTLEINRPTADAKVHKVYAAVAGVYGHGDPGAESLWVEGIGVSLGRSATSNNVTTRFDDVTAALKWRLELLPAGVSTLRTVEGGAPTKNDGHCLFVVWEDDTFDISAVALSFGSELTGQNPSLSVDTLPMDVAAPDFAVDVGIAESFSTGVYPQVSDILVNGVLLDEDAGGYDDGNYADGGLFTIGGDGDGPARERWDATHTIEQDDTSISFDLFGSSMDDYVIALWVFAEGACAVGGGLVDSDGDTVPDACDECPDGDDLVDWDEDGVPDDCELFIDFVQPKRATIEGGIDVRMHGGKYYTEDCTVSIDDEDIPTSYVSATELMLSMPPHDVGLVDLHLDCGDGGESVLRGGFSYYDSASGLLPPELIDVQPATVDAWTEADITLYGEGFEDGVTVDLDGVEVSATYLSSQTILVSLDNSWEPGNVDVGVTNPDGQRSVFPAGLHVSDPEAALAAEQEPEPEEENKGSRPHATGCTTAGTSYGPALLLLLALVNRRRGHGR